MRMEKIGRRRRRRQQHSGQTSQLSNIMAYCSDRFFLPHTEYVLMQDLDAIVKEFSPLKSVVWWFRASINPFEFEWL